MTEIEVAESIITNLGSCDRIRCCYCPAERVSKEKGFDCTDLWDDDKCKRIEWFENFLSENEQIECKVIVNDNIEEKLDKIIKLLEDIKNEN